MQVFKLFYKLLRANQAAIISYFVLLMAITIPINRVYESELNTEFVVEESRIVIFNHDEGNVFSQHLVDYLDSHAELVDIEESREAIADAFFDEKIQYVLTIPEGFGDSLTFGTEYTIPLEKEVTNSQADEAFVDTMLTSYINNARVNAGNLATNPSDEQIAEYFSILDETLDTSIDIMQAEVDGDLARLSAFGGFYTHYASYIFITTFITTFGYAIIAMRNPEIVKRDRMGRLSEGNRLFQSILGSLSFALLYWFFLMLVAYFMYGPNTLFSRQGLLILLSSFLSCFGIQAMSYFIVTISPNKGIINFMSTFIGLFVAFASGLFVPRQFVSPIMQQIAMLASPFWQVRADEIILSNPALSNGGAQDLLTFFGIQILLIAAYYALSFMVQSYRRRQNIYLA
ncbi:ABC transporter permease [Fundicoccus culcitae]|uniref:ABC transporter permease n=1 Tax=Fundicoccus culcitae TaxID=2969821 RepID=A0ABY5P226_9LACT|nr:ABC transporter permease [Fundicoccus culcitae]UUX32753.1 ABC transporter permease [Fundicoccus culcitae]